MKLPHSAPSFPVGRKTAVLNPDVRSVILKISDSVSAWHRVSGLATPREPREQPVSLVSLHSALQLNFLTPEKVDAIEKSYFYFLTTKLRRGVTHAELEGWPTPPEPTLDEVVRLMRVDAPLEERHRFRRRVFVLTRLSSLGVRKLRLSVSPELAAELEQDLEINGLGDSIRGATTTSTAP